MAGVLRPQQEDGFQHVMTEDHALLRQPHNKDIPHAQDVTEML